MGARNTSSRPSTDTPSRLRPAARAWTSISSALRRSAALRNASRPDTCTLSVDATTEWVFLELVTDDGTRGLGEALLGGSEPLLRDALAHGASALVGLDPLTAPAPADPLAGATGLADEMVVSGPSAVHILYPSGMGRSRLRLPAMAEGTTRNRRTVERVRDRLRSQ